MTYNLERREHVGSTKELPKRCRPSPANKNRKNNVTLSNIYSISLLVKKMLSFVVPTVALSGGLWVMWTDDVDVNIVSSSHYYVLAFVVNRATAVSFNLVCMYGDPHHQHTNDIWHDVEAFVVQSQDSPTL